MNTPVSSFFKLTKDVWLAAIEELKPAEMKILFYLLTLKPLQANWFDIEVETIACETKLHKSTVYKAILSLRMMGLLEAEVTSVRIRITEKGRFFSGEIAPRRNFRPQAKTVAYRRKSTPETSYQSRFQTPLD